MKIGEQFCPGILHAVRAKDGMLIRIRVPGGLIDAPQLSAIAVLSSNFADGQIEITSRSNLQLRAIEERNLSEVAAALETIGLLPSRLHDRIRNICTSPLAGLDPEESVDTRPLIHELDARFIADKFFLDLHAKFSFGIYGGPQFSRDQDDLALRAIRRTGSSEPVRFQFFLGGIDTGFAVPLDQAVNCLLNAARSCILLASQHELPVRAKKLLALPGMKERILQTLSVLTQSSRPNLSGAISITPPGIYNASRQDHKNIIPAVPLGRLTSQQGQCLSGAAAESGADIRLAPWRGIVLGNVPLGRCDSTAAQLSSVGLDLDWRSGFQGIAACAGMDGCEASLADVRTDATTLARHLAGQQVLPGWTVNLSGCKKQCAMRNGALAEFIATPSGYLLRINGQLMPEPCSPQAAISRILAARENILSQAPLS